MDRNNYHDWVDSRLWHRFDFLYKFCVWYSLFCDRRWFVTIVNGGSWKSFAIGVAIGAIASAATVAIGGYLAKGYDNWGAFPQKGPIEAALAGALQGSISGGLTSAVYGQNVGKGIAEGGMYGAAGGAAMHYIAPVLKKTYNFIEERLYDAVNGVINLV